MIIGDPSIFAIESGITKAYERASLLALGFFTLHIGGLRYGVLEPEASMLACSLGAVEDRLLRRGTHLAPFAFGVTGEEIADAFRNAVYAPDQEEKSFFGMRHSDFLDLIYSRHLVWAPDGDEAFDDSSYVLQFDLGTQVRLIGFRSTEDFHHDSATLRDIVLDSEVFYSVLQDWLRAFSDDLSVHPMILNE